MSISRKSRVVPVPEEIGNSIPENLTMRYMLLIYGNEATNAQRSAEERQECMQHHFELMESMTKAGVFRAADPLHPTATATTIRVQNGKAIATDGPFAETKEQLGGYYLLDCKDLDEALSWTNKLATVCTGMTGASIEIRPILEIAEMQKQIQQTLAKAG